MLAIVGRGNFSTVWKTRDKETGFIFATKIIDKRKDTGRFVIQNEQAALSTLKHPNIVMLYDTYEDDENVYMVMEYIEGLNVMEKLENQGRFSNVDAFKIFRGVLSAVECMHELGFAHRDLKGDNIMVDTHGNAKIIDFGFCGRVCKIIGKKQDSIGSRAYKAPELLVEGGEKATGDRRKADVWSLGCVLYEILLDRHPFIEGRLRSDLVLSAKYELPIFLTLSAREMLSAMLMLNPEERITCTQALAHSWVIINSKKLYEREAKERLKAANTTEDSRDEEEGRNADTTREESNAEPMKVERDMKTTIEPSKQGKKRGALSRIRAFFKRPSCVSKK